MSTDESSRIENIRIQGCHIENIGHTGIKLTGARPHISRVWLYNNRVIRTVGPGIKLTTVKPPHIANNEVTYSGSSDETHKCGSGSGFRSEDRGCGKTLITTW